MLLPAALPERTELAPAHLFEAVEGTDRIELDLRGSLLVKVPALEILLQAKRLLSDRGVELCLVGSAPAVDKALQLMKVAEEVKRARQ
ncbi:MAG: STAS domain-containing protein [Thermoanaerobaculia bacterium]